MKTITIEIKEETFAKLEKALLEKLQVQTRSHEAQGCVGAFIGGLIDALAAEGDEDDMRELFKDLDIPSLKQLPPSADKCGLLVESDLAPRGLFNVACDLEPGHPDDCKSSAIERSVQEARRKASLRFDTLTDDQKAERRSLITDGKTKENAAAYHVLDAATVDHLRVMGVVIGANQWVHVADDKGRSDYLLVPTKPGSKINQAARDALAREAFPRAIWGRR